MVTFDQKITRQLFNFQRKKAQKLGPEIFKLTMRNMAQKMNKMAPINMEPFLLLNLKQQLLTNGAAAMMKTC